VGQWRRDIRRQLGLESREQRRELERRSEACLFPRFDDPIYIEGWKICRGGRRGEERVALAGAEATVTGSGDLHRHVPTGVFLRDTTDTRELYLTIKANDGELVARLGPDQQQAAREFAARLNTMAKQRP
jgi:hypothetical protein